jgi:hypothetical protein
MGEWHFNLDVVTIASQPFAGYATDCTAPMEFSKELLIDDNCVVVTPSLVVIRSVLPRHLLDVAADAVLEGRYQDADRIRHEAYGHAFSRNSVDVDRWDPELVDVSMTMRHTKAMELVFTGRIFSFAEAARNFVFRPFDRIHVRVHPCHKTWAPDMRSRPDHVIAYTVTLRGIVVPKEVVAGDGELVMMTQGLISRDVQ